jgi:regulator of sirC expression with transglutaminase-like and TPR domain
MKFQVPTHLEYFKSLVQGDDGFPLLEAAVCLSQDVHPELDVQDVLAQMDVLLERIKRRMPEDASAMHRLRSLNHYFYEELKFAGNRNDFYNPNNSYLHEVLRTRRGIPISLAVIWLELAAGLNLNAHGISFPGHFLVKITLLGGLVVLDPLTGESLGIDNLAERLGPYRDDIDWAAGADLDDGETPLGLYLQACPARDLLARMLRNLKEIFRAQEDWPRMLQVLNRLVILLPESWTERRDRGLVHAELGDVQAARLDLQTYLDAEPLAPDQTALRHRISELSGG